VSPTVLIIWFIAMAVFTATVLVVGTLLAADILPRHHRPSSADSGAPEGHGYSMH
jgi:hypothetical protein